VAQQAELFADMGVTYSTHGEWKLHRLSEAVMNKFNNTLEGADCGDAGLPAHSCDIAKAKTVLRVVPKTPDIESMALCTMAPSAATGAESDRPISSAISSPTSTRGTAPSRAHPLISACGNLDDFAGLDKPHPTLT
jgi:hypothetical protein